MRSTVKFMGVMVLGVVFSMGMGCDEPKKGPTSSSSGGSNKETPGEMKDKNKNTEKSVGKTGGE